MPSSDLPKLLARLASGKPVAAVLLHGDDAYLRQATRAALVDAIVPEGMREWAVARFSLGERDLVPALQQAQTLPMLSPRQVVFVEDAEELEHLSEKEREPVMEALEAYLDDPAPFTLLVFEATKLDQRMTLFKLLNEKALVVEAGLSEKFEERVPLVTKMAQQMAADLGVTLEAAAADELVELTNAELARVHNELKKLAAYVGERKRIALADVDALVVSEKKYTIWELADLLAARRRDAALQFLNGLLREGEEPPAIVGALAWMYRGLIVAHDLPRHATVWDLLRQVRMQKETAEKALAAARRIPREQLLEGLRALYEADSRLKSGVANPNAVLEFLLARLTAPPMASARGM